MSDAGYGFATGFAQGFSQSYAARMQNEADEKRDKIRFGAQAWLKQEERYNAAKQADDQLMQQAEALVESQSLIPKDATIDIYNMLRGGMTSSQIISDVRTSGAKFEALPTPSESALDVSDTTVSTEVGDQTDAMLSEENNGLSPGANSPGLSVPNATEVAGENTATAIVPNEEEDPNNPFAEYQKEIRDAVGQTDNPYFDQVLAGYTPEVRQNKYKFIPGVTKTDIPSLQDMLAASVYNSEEYQAALDSGDEKAQQTLVIEAMARSKRSESGDVYKFGTGGVASAMYAWVMTDAGKAAVASKDGQAIAKQWRVFDSVINPDKDNTSEFDMSDPYTSFFNSWIASPEGQKAVTGQDGDAISEAMAKAEEQAEIVTNALNLAAGFKPEELTDLKMVPGLREKFAKYPIVLTQISRIAEALTTQEQSKDSPTSAKPYTVYSGQMVDGRAHILGTGLLQSDGTLILNGEEVPREVASKYVLASSDAPLDFSKVSTNEFTKRLTDLESAVNFGETAAFYTAGLRKTPTARTRVARFASGVDELLTEFDAARQVASFQGVGKDGSPEVQIDGTKFVESIQRGDGALGKFSAEVRAIMAQEAQIVFAFAKADGQTGNALSNKDYDNYFKTIFNSNNPQVVEQNLKRLVGMKYNVALRSANKIGSLPGMDMALQGTGGAWWSDPRGHVEKDLQPGVVQFLGAATKGVDDVVNTLVPEKTLEESIKAFQAGETITVTQEMIDTYPAVFAGKKVGQTFNKAGAN